MENPSSLIIANQTTNSNPTAIDVAKVAAEIDNTKCQIQRALGYVATLSTEQYMKLRGMKEAEYAWAK